MTVAELVELLQGFDPAAAVMLADPRGSIFNAKPEDVRYGRSAELDAALCAHC